MTKNFIKVLVLEDNGADLRLLEEYLSEVSDTGFGFDLTIADSLGKALENLRGGKFDIILSDLFLPDSTGLDTFSALCRQAPDTPVIVLTALENEDVALRAVHSGAQEYLVKKSLTGEILWRSIRYSMERKQVEASLRASEDRYRTLIDAMDDAIVVLDRDLRVIMDNPAFRNPCACPVPGPAMTGRVLMPETPALPPGTLELCRRVFSEAKILVAEERHQLCGRDRILEVKAIPVRGKAGVERVVALIRDITERKQMEEIKDEFASLVSHELRSPLTTVTAGLAMTLDGELGPLRPEARKILAAAYDDAQRLNRIINKLLEISRLGAGKTRFKKEPVDIVGLARSVASRFSAQARERNIGLKQNFSAEKIEAWLDLDGINEVFTNLLSNALKFTENGDIEIAAVDKGAEIECYVRDSGIGISRDDQPKLFCKFRQFSRPVAGAEKGNGLGLFIVKEIIRLHNGRLEVSSEPGKGTRFSFYLPKNAAEEPADPAGKGPAST